MLLLCSAAEVGPGSVTLTVSCIVRLQLACFSMLAVKASQCGTRLSQVIFTFQIDTSRAAILQSMARVNPQTYNSIKALTENPDTVVVIFSGSGKAGIQQPLQCSNAKSSTLKPTVTVRTKCLAYLLLNPPGQPADIAGLTCAQEQLEETFGTLHVWLAAENGIFMRPPPTHAEPKPVRYNRSDSSCSDDM